ncbi:sarcoplasmic calcium-binding protein-like [Saccostrea cucullata]|uniref:sarcoplasmic calcium-binding protein-like n=1 Tax=Saccostrea cuccullata TaxID=36930 RepID=UPI002ED5B6D2
MPYALYVLIALIFIPEQNKKWFLRRKWRQWVRLLDADQDGVISADDMERTNAKLEQIRRLVGARNTPLSAQEQKKWWNNNIFKSGPGKSISMTDYISWLESSAPPHEMASKLKPMVTGFFNFFSTEDYEKKNLIMSEDDFVKFWTILADINERHCREVFVKHIPSPLTMAYFMEDFVAFLSHNEFWNEYGYRVFNILKYKDTSRCCRV